MGMTTEREGAILERAIAKFGSAAQTDMMIEKMSELTKALIKLRRESSSVWLVRKWPVLITGLRANVVEEIADVQIMLNQMQLLYGDCTEWEIKKLERLAERLGMEDAEA